MAGRGGRSGLRKQKREAQAGDAFFGTQVDYFPLSDYDFSKDPERPSRWERHQLGGQSYIPPNRENCGCAVVGSGVYLFGGLGSGPDGRYNLLCRFDLGTLDWKVEQSKDGLPPEPRCKHSVSSYAECVYVYGGEGAFDGEFCSGDKRCTREMFNKVFEYNTEKRRWRPLPTVGEPPERRIPFARRSHSAEIVSNFLSKGPALLIFGGAGLEPIRLRDRHFNDMWAFSIERCAWSYVYQTGEIPSPRSGHSWTRFGDKIFLYGGLTAKGTSDELFVFDTKTLRWDPLMYSGHGPSARYNHSAVVHPWSPNGGKILVLGGRTGGGSSPPSSTVHCFDVASGHWSEVHTSGRSPEGRFGMVAWTYCKNLVLYGGCNTRGYCNSDIYRLELAEPPLKPDDLDLVEAMAEEHRKSKIEMDPPPDESTKQPEVSFSASALVDTWDDKDWGAAAIAEKQSCIAPSSSYKAFRSTLSSASLLLRGGKSSFSVTSINSSPQPSLSVADVPESNALATEESRSRKGKSLGSLARPSTVPEIPPHAIDEEMASMLDVNLLYENSLTLKDVLTLGNGSFFVDFAGVEEERRVLNDKSWRRQYLQRAYKRPQMLRRSGTIAMRGRRRPLTSQVRKLLPDGCKIRERPSTRMQLSKSVSALDLRERARTAAHTKSEGGGSALDWRQRLQATGLEFL